MNRRRHLLLLAVTVLAATLAVGTCLLWPTTQITQENAARIREGMALADVETILGGPARDESTGPLMAALPDYENAPERGMLAVQLMSWNRGKPGFSTPAPILWKSNRAVIRVDLDFGGRVRLIRVLPVRRVQENPLDMLRRWLQL
jgi:hypothetical protein